MSETQDRPGPTLTLEDRIHGCLLGAAIGAELGFAREVEPQRFTGQGADRLDPRALEPVVVP